MPHLEPSKIILSTFVSVMILAVGVTVMRSANPRLAIADFVAPLANNAVVNSFADNVLSIEPAEGDQKTQEYEQNTPENARMETEAMAASIEQHSPSNSSDWSLELISDRALEITR